MTTFKSLYWTSYSDSELQRIVSDSGHLTTFRLDAMKELNRRTLTKRVKQ